MVTGLVMPTVVLVWHDGGIGEYREEHVLALAAAVFKWWPPSGMPARVVVLSNRELTDPRWGKFPRAVERRPLMRGLPGWWNKLEVCDAQHDDLGAVLYLDLDTMVTGDLAPVLETVQRAEWPVLLQDFYHNHRTNSGVLGLSVAARRDLRGWWHDATDIYPHGIESIAREFRGDGDFIDHHYRDTATVWQTALPAKLLSYKVHVRQVRGEPVPASCALLCFHGHPRPWQSRLWQPYLNTIGL